jgi:hypothetical protein
MMFEFLKEALYCNKDDLRVPPSGNQQSGIDKTWKKNGPYALDRLT